MEHLPTGAMALLPLRYGTVVLGPGLGSDVAVATMVLDEILQVGRRVGAEPGFVTVVGRHDDDPAGTAASARGRLAARRRSGAALCVWISVVVVVEVPERLAAGGLPRGGRGLPLARNSRMWPAV
jgi:hypothetical protein